MCDIYTVDVECSNCLKYTPKLQIPKGVRVSQTKCPHCGNITLYAYDDE